MSKHSHLTLIPRDAGRPEPVKFLVFGQYTHGRRKGLTNYREYVSMTILGQDSRDENGDHVPAFVDAIRNLRRKLGGDTVFTIPGMQKSEVKRAAKVAVVEEDASEPARETASPAIAA